jgi:16S rRNA (cytosine1407-C5)-methyltransferase
LEDKSNKVFDYIEKLYGKPSSKKYEEFIKSDHSSYIRINKFKTNSDELQKILKDKYGISTETISGFSNALKISSNKNLAGKTIEHIIGLYYIQNLSSMIPALVLNPTENDIVLDLCAAPGSKTTQLAELKNNKGTLIANEISADRVKMLVYNLDRMNIINTGVLHRKGEWLSKVYQNYFDKILIDAPCSGLGIIQKKEGIFDWWSKEKAENLSELQIKLVVAGLKMLKTGGDLVYSTCTLTVEENELMLNKILRKYPVKVLDINLPVKSYEGFTAYEHEKLDSSLSKSKRILPWEVDSEGFFIIKLKKIGETIPPIKEQLNLTNTSFMIDRKNHAVKNYLDNTEDEFGIEKDIFSNYKFLIKKNDIFFIDKNWEDENLSLFERIGTKFGTIDNKNKLVLHTQAAQLLHNNIKNKIYNIKDNEELKTYLRGGIIKKSLNELGQYAIKYENQILGTAIALQEGIKSRFPRAKRTQEIYLDF